MPRDLATPLTTARFPSETLRYASARRAELHALLESLGHSRRRGFVPFERRALPMTIDNIRRLGRLAPVVLP